MNNDVSVERRVIFDSYIYFIRIKAKRFRPYNTRESASEKKEQTKNKETGENKFTENTKKICLVVFIVVKRFSFANGCARNFTICRITRRMKNLNFNPSSN